MKFDSIGIQFFLGVVTSLVATVLFLVILQIKTRSVLSFEVFMAFWRLARRLRDNGVSNFFASRADYARYRPQGAISEYIETTHRELIYVGFWLAQGIEINNIKAIIPKLLRENCLVEFVFLSPDFVAMDQLAEYLGVSPKTIRARVMDALESMVHLRNSLPPELSGRFILKVHKQLITSSAFVFDHGTPKAKTLIDIKLFGLGRERTFGIELRATKSPDTLYAHITRSFMDIRKTAQVWE